MIYSSLSKIKWIRYYIMLNNLLVVEIFGSEAQELAYPIVNGILIALMALVAVGAIICVMLQPSNSQGIEALGGSSETFYGKNKGKSIEAKLKLWTIICVAVLAVLSIIFFILQIPAIWA